VKVIANTTVISNFASVGRLDLLQALSGEVFISSGVYDLDDAPVGHPEIHNSYQAMFLGKAMAR